MATVDVLSPDNWNAYEVGRTTEHTDVGWTGEYYRSYGAVQLIIVNNYEVDSNRINSCTFSTTLVGTTTQQIRIKDSYGYVLVDQTVNNSGTVTLSPYNETGTYIGIVEFEYSDGVIEASYNEFFDEYNWQGYPYHLTDLGGGNFGSPAIADYELHLNALSFIYGDEPPPPYVWKDYTNTRETLTL